MDSLFECVDCIELFVTDLKQGIRFYAEGLGLKVLWKTETSVGLGMDHDITEIVLQTERPGKQVDFKVKSVEAALPNIIKAGGSVIYGPFDIPIGRCAVVKDVWDNQYVILDMTKGKYVTDTQGNVVDVKKAGLESYDLYPISDAYRAKVNDILKEEWNCPPSISKGMVIDTTKLPGFVCVEDGAIIGVITYQMIDSECEIVTLNSFKENIGVGTKLIQAVREVAKQKGCKRIWLITTNDDTKAIRFYQRFGFDLVAAHINAMDISRRLKPEIPYIGIDGIPIKHEFEFELRLTET